MLQPTNTNIKLELKSQVNYRRNTFAGLLAAEFNLVYYSSSQYW